MSFRTLFYSFFLLLLLAGSKLALAENLLFKDSQKQWLIAQNEQNVESTYDPFVDYSEFENTAEEQKSINFFQTGRFLSVSAQGGVQFFTQNMAAIYEVGPIFGGHLNYFFNLSFALQFGVLLSTHNIILQSSGGQPFIGGVDFLSLSLDFKYLFDRKLFHRSMHWLQPFLFLGFGHSKVTMVATLTDQPGFYEDSGFGFNIGGGFEFLFSKKVYAGLLYTFRYINFSEEARPIAITTQDSQTKIIDFAPFGDWMHVTMILGVNF